MASRLILFCTCTSEFVILDCNGTLYFCVAVFLLAPVFSRQIMVSSRLSWGRCQPDCSGVTSPEHHAVTLLYFCSCTSVFLTPPELNRHTLQPGQFPGLTLLTGPFNSSSFFRHLLPTGRFFPVQTHVSRSYCTS